MSKLYQARKHTLTKPLSKDEMGYVYGGKCIPLIVKDIREKKYGSYLVGGVVGTGKSSQVEIASNLAIKDPLIIHIKFCNESECIKEFEKVLIKELMKAINESKPDQKTNTLLSIIEECEKRLQYIVDEKEQEEDTQEQENRKNEAERVLWGGKIGTTFRKVFCGDAYISGEVQEDESRNLTQNKRYKSTITMTKIQSTQLELIYQILEVLSEENIIFIYDEIDKMHEDILKLLFEKYKTLFVEKNIFNFFIVNDAIYKKYSDSNLMNNSLYTYFMGIYYVPLLRLNETICYSKMMFGEEKYINGLVTYYLCLGNFRMINQKYLSAYCNKEIDIAKSYILKKVIEKLSFSYFDDYMRDILVRKIKTTIERMIVDRNFKISELAKKMDEECGNVGTWPDYVTIIDSIVETIRMICVKAVVLENEVVTIKGEVLISESYLIEELINTDREEEIPEEERHLIQLSDMYYYIKRNHSYSKPEISFLNKDIIPLKVADNDATSYKEILVNLLYTNIMEKGIQVIAVRRARGDESWYPDDYEYTGIVVVDKGIFEIAYYVDRGSYKSENKDVIDGFIEEAEKLGIRVEKMTALGLIDIEKDIMCIVGRYNNPYSELYEHRKVICENWL